MANSTKKFGDMFSKVNTASVKDVKLSNTIDSGAYSAEIKALYFSKGRESNAMGFSAEVYIPSEDKTLYVKNVNFLKKDGDANSIGLSQLKSFLRATDDNWDDKEKDFIALAEVGEATRLTRDNKPYTVNEFTNAVGSNVAALVETLRTGENGTPYNSLKMVVNLEDKDTIEAFKALVEKTPIRTIEPKADSNSGGGMSTGESNKKAKSAASKL